MLISNLRVRGSRELTHHPNEVTRIARFRNYISICPDGCEGCEGCVFLCYNPFFFSLVRVCQINMMGFFTVLSVERNNDFILSMFGVFKIQRDQWTAKKYIQLHDTV